jgi:hypothetical protein
MYTSWFSIARPDFTAQCLDAQQAGATSIYFAEIAGAAAARADAATVSREVEITAAAAGG